MYTNLIIHHLMNDIQYSIAYISNLIHLIQNLEFNRPINNIKYIFISSYIYIYIYIYSIYYIVTRLY